MTRYGRPDMDPQMDPRMQPQQMGRRRSNFLGGIGGRLLIALAIAAFALISFYSKPKVTNPETGETYRIGMDVEQEIAMGMDAAPKMAAQMGGAVNPGSETDADFVRRMGQHLIENSTAKGTPYAENFNFYLLADPETINAFALPGGQIFITRGLYTKLGSEAELAGVLGHEIGHVVGQHSARQMAKGQLGQMLATAAGVGIGGGDVQAMRAAQMASQMVSLSYGRDDEKNADLIGLKYMSQAGFDPEAMLGVMKVLAEAMQGPRPAEFMSSHPHPETRMETINGYLAEHKSELAQLKQAGKVSMGDPLPQAPAGAGTQQLLRDFLGR